jgi:glycosyltransferase involved in cell wall biosynthesis
MRVSKVFILVPLFNEEEFIAPLLDRVLTAPIGDGLEREIVVVDDGSTDGSAEIVEAIAVSHPDTIRLIRHGRNRGKGAAVRTAIAQARGEISSFRTPTWNTIRANTPRCWGR